MSRYIDTVVAAKMIRFTLKKKFPGTVFSVKSSRYAGGSSIRVSWKDGPAEKRVRKVTDPFAGAGFDGMIDMQYYKSSILLADGTVTYGSSPGTVGSRGSVSEYDTPLPKGAEKVSFGCNYVQTERRFSWEYLVSFVDRFNREELRSGEKAVEVVNSSWGPRLDVSDNNVYSRFYRFLAEEEGVAV